LLTGYTQNRFRWSSFGSGKFYPGREQKYVDTSADIQYETGLDANELEKVINGTESNEAFLVKDNSMPEAKSSLAQQYL